IVNLFYSSFDYFFFSSRRRHTRFSRDWSSDVCSSDLRVICLAPEYKKYDLHAVQVMGANIELWQYKIYENGILNIEEAYKKSTNSPESVSGKNPIMVKAGRKAASTR